LKTLATPVMAILSATRKIMVSTRVTPDWRRLDRLGFALAMADTLGYNSGGVETIAPSPIY
jgi:hypothetical protein